MVGGVYGSGKKLLTTGSSRYQEKESEDIESEVQSTDTSTRV